MISQRRFRAMSARHAAQELAQLLEAARAYLITFRCHVCPACHHVFSPDHRLDMRCPDCADAAAEVEQVLL